MNSKKEFYVSITEKLISFIISFSGWIYFLFSCVIFSKNQVNKHQNINGLLDSYFGMKRVSFNIIKDFSDHQWFNYRSNLFFLWIFLGNFTLISYLIKTLTSSRRILKAYSLAVGLGFAIYLHGPKIIILLLILVVNYFLTIYTKNRTLMTLLIWVNCCSLKVLSEIYRGFSLSYVGIIVNESCKFDWHCCFNLVLLRIISFSMEFKISKENKKEDKYSFDRLNKIAHCEDCKNLNYCQRYLINKEIDTIEFTITNYLIYIFYPPLYFTGPIITFNSFIFQLNTQTKATTFHIKINYFLHYLVIFFSMEIFNHLVYPHAFLMNVYNEWMLGDFDDFTLAIMCFHILLFIWLKLNFIWRTARLFSMIDNIEPEENMNRCVYNNYCFEGFWRAWHRSFNQWLIKYIFIPLGGNRFKAISIWVIFTFVALWHDLEIKLIAWAWLNCVFLLFEMLAKKIAIKYSHYNKYFGFRVLQYLGGGFGIILLIISNLVGFGLGHCKLIEIIFHNLKSFKLGSWTVILIFQTFHTITQFEIREIEKKYKSNLNY